VQAHGMLDVSRSSKHRPVCVFEDAGRCPFHRSVKLSGAFPRIARANINSRFVTAKTASPSPARVRQPGETLTGPGERFIRHSVAFTPRSRRCRRADRSSR
jgi:hypothetical protein